MAGEAKKVKVKTLRPNVTTAREGSNEVDAHKLGAVIEVGEAVAERLLRIGAAEKTTAKATEAS